LGSPDRGRERRRPASRYAIRAYAERSAQRRLDSALQGAAAVRHKPHAVLAVIGPFNLSRALARRAKSIPALDPRQCGDLQTQRESARDGAKRWSAAFATAPAFPRAVVQLSRGRA
jgi:acyl-CoA reductase-like NAD-dependent aldehyde dehydrogenase